MEKKNIVLSGVNLVDAGPLSVYLDFLEVLIKDGYHLKYNIIALVGKKELFCKYENKITIIEYRNAKKNWLNRIYLEYFGFKKISLKIDVDTWISLHDMTPNVKAKHRFVYCHNPSPFNKMSIKEVKFGLKYYLFSKFYKYLYKINIKKNDAVIVQQEWMRKEFIKIYKLKNVIVARPSLPKIGELKDKSNKRNKTIFVCPSFPRYYKNFEIACEAATILEKSNIDNFVLFVTLDGSENKYAKYIKDKYSNALTIKFCGILSRQQLFELYSYSRCLIFMSKLETWGLPITEYKSTNKSIIAADLPYAHETVGEYNHVVFLNPHNADEVAIAMKEVILNGTLSNEANMIKLNSPYADNWEELCEMIFK